MPVLRDDDSGDGNGNQYGQRCSDVDGKADGEQRNGDQCLAKPEDGSDSE